MRISVLAVASLGLALLMTSRAAFAQDDAPQPPIPFEGGTLTISDSDDGDMVLAFNGKELARNAVAYFDKMVDLDGVKVALFALGDGGNQCGPEEVIVWKPQGSDIKTTIVGPDCGAPPAAVTGGSIYFVPYLLPGDTNTVQVWAPDTGLEVAGTITYAPQPDTDWKDLDPAKFEYIIDSMKNAAVYAAAQKLLGDHVFDVVSGLQTGGTTEKTTSGILYASGCVPHACGGSDTFMAIDPPEHKVYFAQQGDDPQQPSTWPDLKTWPDEVKTLMQQAIGR